MKTITKYPLTLVHAGAGYGKSTALALFVSDEKASCCWYSITSSDDDIITFLTYMVATIQKEFPLFGEELKGYMNDMNPYVREHEITHLCTLFINEIVHIADELTLILDDFHQIEHSYNVNHWMEKLLEHIPENLHIVASSRSKPIWKPLKKMKVSQQLLEITKDDLVLTKAEVELLLNELYEIELDEEQVEEIFLLTEGWVIALGMFAQQLLDQTGMEKVFKKTLLTSDDLFHYLALEVFEKQPPMIQQFLEQTSVLEEINEAICEEVLGVTGAEEMLKQIHERNLFIHKLGEEQFRYHALFKEFLEGQLRLHQPRNFILIHERCARYFEQRGRWERAVGHYEMIGNFEAMAALLNDYGVRLLESGKLESLHERLMKMSHELKERYYKLWFLQGEVERYRSLYEEAASSYEHAINMAEKRGDWLEKSKALEGKAKIYLDTIQPYNAERLLYQAIEIREQSDISTEEETQRLYQLLAENLINSGKAAKAEKWLKRAYAFNDRGVDGNLEARLYLRTGRLEKARKTLLSKQKLEMKHTLPQSHRETDLLLSLIEAFRGNGEEAKRLSQIGIQQGIEIQSPFVEACGWIRMGHAVQLLHKYDVKLAKKCYETALEIMDQIHVERGKAEPLMGLCLLYGSKGEYERAIEVGEAALLETERVEDLWLSSLITMSMGIASVYNERFKEAFGYLQKAEKMLESCQDEYGKMLVYFWQAYTFFSRQKIETYKKYMLQFLKSIQLGNYEFFFHSRSIFGPRDLQVFAPLLIESYKEGLSTSYVGKLLQEMGLTQLDSHPGYTLRVETLGQFKVWLGDREVQERDWQRGKAKELFQFFITEYKYMFTKEELFQMLWTNQSEKGAARDFKVALNALHNALEPNRKARATPFFVIREGSTYGINANAHLELDTIEFEEWVNHGLDENEDREKAISCLEKGLQRYKGDFLHDRVFDDWCLNERERLLVLFLRGAEKLAQLYVRKEDYSKAIFWCERILEKDRTWEEAYRLLMFCYYRKNNRPFAMKWYQKCSEILEEELGVTPLEPTQHMYEMILEAQENIHPI
ncbi:BTAD domain-containing putative transcriptional regulator [Robertmurraya sp. 2P01SA]